MVTGASWVHFKPRKTKIGQKKGLTPFLHESLQFIGYCFQHVFVIVVVVVVVVVVAVMSEWFYLF